MRRNFPTEILNELPKSLRPFLSLYFISHHLLFDEPLITGFCSRKLKLRLTVTTREKAKKIKLTTATGRILSEANANSFLSGKIMETERIERIQAVTSRLIWITLIFFAYGFAYKNQPVMLAGMFGLGIALIIHAPLSFVTLNRWQKADAKTKLAFWGEGFFALGQLIFGICALAGAIADLSTNYLTSGRFWHRVSEYPWLFLFVFGSFCSLVGISQIAANLKLESEKLVDKLGSLTDIIQGIIFLLFGLFFIGLILFAKLF